ncbi:MAG: RHS repeat protein [Cyclobacteriaceae bacterium]|nr:RHS repeat protein [Cyclobacteriaceae bacterium]
MKKIFTKTPFVVVYLFALAIVPAEGQPINPHAETVNRYHASPKAGEIFRQGNIPVNLSSGQVSYSIPIHTVKIDGFEWPINLNYAYNGLLLENKGSGAGLGWSLSGSGAVVRQVRGLPDEHIRGFWGTSNTTHRNYLDNFDVPGDIPLHIVKDFVSGMNDSEPDKFSLNAGSLNLTFYIANLNDPAGCPYSAYYVTSTAEAVKICFSWSRIEATDAHGTTYSFGMTEVNSFSSPHPENELYMETYPSAWYLDEIRLANGRSISLGYGSKAIVSKSYTEAFNRTVNPAGQPTTIDCGTAPGGFNSLEVMHEDFRELSYKSTVVESNISAKYPTSVSWDEGAVGITYGTGEGANELPYIQSITVTASDESVRHEFDFTYDQQPRALLSSVVKDTDETYSFEYNRVFVGVPTAAPFAQDFWGFANGRPNHSAIPEKGGDRNPDFRTASQGALTKITYPTGGTTTIMYEPNQVRVSSEDLTGMGPPMNGANQQLSVSATSLPLNEWHYEYRTIIFERPVYAKISHGIFVNGTPSVANISFGPGLGTSWDPAEAGDYEVRSAYMRSLAPGIVPAFRPTVGRGLTGDIDNSLIGNNCGAWGACTVGGLVDWILILPGTYTLYINSYNGGAVNYYFNLEYYDPDPEDIEPSYFDVNAAGIRVFRTVDCPDPSQSGCTTKTYQYVNEDGQSSGLYLGKIDYSYEYTVKNALDCRDYGAVGGPATALLVEYSIPAISYSFRTLNPLEFHAGSPVYYKRVEVHDMVRGVEVQHFENSTYGLVGSYPYTPKPENPINGAVAKTQAFDSSPSLVQESIFGNAVTSPTLNYALFPDGIVFGVAQEYTYQPTMEPEDFTNILLTQAYVYAKYEVETPTKLLVANREDRYFSLPQVKITSNTYDGNLFLKTTETTDSKGKSSKQKFYYAYDLSDSGYTELVSINKIGSPVKTEVYYDDVLRKSSQTFYKAWHTSPKKIVEPRRIETTQGGITVVEATINSYSPEGNVLEVTPRAGVKGALLWGYDNLFPVAEVKGAAQGSFAYTGFEENCPAGGWSFTSNPVTTQSKTGLRAHEFTAATISRSGLSSTETYKLSYWAKGGTPTVSAGVTASNDAGAAEADGWRYFEKTITGVTSFSISATAGVFLDELRIHPKAATMTTLTYKTLVGVTSQTDANSRITYYEYDDAGRLARVRDHQRNIVKQHDYAYRALPAVNNY